MPIAAVQTSTQQPNDSSASSALGSGALGTRILRLAAAAAAIHAAEQVRQGVETAQELPACGAGGAGA